MRKQFLAFAVVLLFSTPSITFAEVVWYGSFAGGIKSEDGETTLSDYSSVWGVEGSTEISPGLSAIFQFEAFLDLANATINPEDDEGVPEAGLAYVGLTGGFGTLAMGRLIGAPDLVTGIIDNSLEWGEGPDAAELDSVVSYAVDAGPASIQLDLVMDSGEDTLDRTLFGSSFEVGNGSVALFYDKNKSEFTETGLAAEQAFGPVRLYLGGIQNKPEEGDKTTNYFLGFDGSIGDSGLTYLVQATRKKDVTGKPTPIVLNVTKELGGSSAISFEAKTNDKDDEGAKIKTAAGIALIVDF